MAITIDFGPEKEALVWEKAARSGQKADERIYDLVSEWLEEPELDPAPQEVPAQTLAEALAGHIGTQHSGRGNLSQNTGKAFARLMVEKRKAGKL